MKYYTKVITAVIDGEKVAGVDMTEELVKALNLVEGQVIEWDVQEDGRVVLTKTNLVNFGE